MVVVVVSIQHLLCQYIVYIKQFSVVSVGEDLPGHFMMLILQTE